MAIGAISSGWEGWGASFHITRREQRGSGEGDFQGCGLASQPRWERRVRSGSSVAPGQERRWLQDAESAGTSLNTGGGWVLSRGGLAPKPEWGLCSTGPPGARALDGAPEEADGDEDEDSVMWTTWHKEAWLASPMVLRTRDDPVPSATPVNPAQPSLWTTEVKAALLTCEPTLRTAG